MKAIISGVLMAALTSLAAQVPISSIPLQLSPAIQLELPEDAGLNGGAVTWHPQHRLYYTVMAGNEDYPLDVFSADGEHILSMAAGYDVRGLWYNPAMEYLEANTYKSHNIISYALYDDGLPVDEDPYVELLELPVSFDQAVLAYDALSDRYVYYDNATNELVFLQMESGEEVGRQYLQLPVSRELINNTTAMATGITGGEYALLNYVDAKLYLIDSKSGELRRIVSLPAGVQPRDMFNCSFANGHLWLFDPEARVWTGYKLY